MLHNLLHNNLQYKFKVLGRTVGYVYKRDIVACISRDASFLVQTALEMYLINVGGLFIDAVADILTEGESFTLEQFFYSSAFRYLAIVLAIWIINKSISNFREYLKEMIMNSIYLDSDEAVLTKNSDVNLQEVEHKKYQELMTFVPSYSIDRIFETYDTFSEMLRYLIRLIASVSILYRTLGISSLFLVVIAIPEPLVQYFGEKKIQKLRLSEVEGTKFLNYLMKLAVAVQNFAELKVNGIYKYIRKVYYRGSERFKNAVLEKQKHYLIDNAFFAMIGQILMSAYVVFLLFVAIAQKLTIGHFKALYDYANAAYNSAYFALRLGFKMFDHISYTEEFFMLLDYEGFGDLDTGNAKLKAGTPVLRFENLDFQYPDSNVKALENNNFTIMPGEKVAFIGGDGSGKSSIVKALCGLYEIKAGDYTIDSLSVRELDRGELKKKLSVIFQDFVRYNFSVKRNITISSERDRINKELYNKVKKIAGVDLFMKKEGLDDEQILGKYFTGGREISPGYWQRLAIARMLYRNRKIFIMDEPFTYIDGPSRVKILEGVMKFIGPERTLIYITQNTDHLKMFDRVYFLQHGKIVESGTYNELIKKKGKFYKETKANQ